MGSRRNRIRCRGGFDQLELRGLLSLVLSPINITATQDVPFSSVVATLVDSDRTASPSDFNNPPGSVQVNWGDGVTSAGLVVGPISPGVFYVDASHTYASSGSYTTQISVNDQSGNSAIASGLATVTTSASPELTIVANTIKGSAGTALSGVPVANFLDPNPSDIASDFAAVITWGNGNTSIGLIQGGNGAFTVYGTSTYGAQGSYNTTVTVISTNNGLDGYAGGTAKIGPTSTYSLTGQQIVENASAPFSAEVATFTDANLTDTSADFSATIAWGDGETSQGTVNEETASGGVLNFSITGSHVYALPGTEAITVTLVDQHNSSSYTTSTANVTGPVLTPLPTTINPSLAQSFTGVVGSFFDTNMADNSGTLTATITWGDGQTTQGLIEQRPGVPELWDVYGTNTYAVAGTYPVGITVDSSNNNQSTTIASIAIVAAPTFTATGTAFPAAPGIPLATSTVVADFIDTNPNANASNLTAEINWGDGQAATPGTVISTGSPDSYVVTGTHIYANPSASGSYTVTVTIGDPNNLTIQATSAAFVASPLAASGTTFSTTAGQPLSSTTVVANLIDTNADANAQNISAVINWGDGQTSPGLVNATSATGVYTVSGGHTYSSSSATGSYTVSVTIADPDGPTTKAVSTAFVVAPITANGTVFVTTPGVQLPQNTVVASFIDANAIANANPSLIKAIINWGDGQTSPGTINLIGPVNGNPSLASYNVTGSHSYSPSGTAGSYAVSVTIYDPSGQQVSVTSTGLVNQFINATGTNFTATVGQPVGTSPLGVTVANFTDSNPNANSSTITAVIHWGDGQTSTGTISGPIAGEYTVTGNHTYASAGLTGVMPILVTIVDASGQTTAIESTAILASSISATGLNFTATVGQAFANLPVATFYDSNPNASMSTAVINWGDGQSTPGVITGPNPSGLYVVTGNHTYANGNATNTFPVVVTIVDPAGQTAGTTSTATVAAPTIVATGTTFSTTPGQLLSNVLVANFTDSNLTETASTITAVINWGDGQTTTGTVNSTTTAGVYTVTGNHSYSATSANGSYSITVTIADQSGQTATAKSMVYVTQFINATGTSFTATVGQPTGSVVVANFTDSNPDLTNLSAVINWGDGQTTNGVVNPTGSPGGYSVTGNHTYSSAGAAGTFVVLVKITDSSGQEASTSSTAILASPISANGNNFTATVGEPVGQPPEGVVVATFTDSNPNAQNSTAVINWGDGKSTPGSITGPNASGVYTVTGNHAYVTASATGSYSVTVTITDSSGQTAKVTSTVTVAAPAVIATGTTFSTSQAATGAIVANFTDSNTTANSGTITAVINWGDGQSSTGTVNATSTPYVYSVSGSHSYTIPSAIGSYVVTVTISDPSGQTATVKSTAQVVAPVLSPIPLTVDFTAGTPPSSPVTVGSFFDTNIIATPANFTVSINWGAGQSSKGTVTASLTTPGLFLVSGSYLYPAANTYQVIIAVQDNKGDLTTIDSTAVVATNIATTGPNIGFTGGLDPDTGNGPHAANGYTTTNQPTFSGYAVPFSTVQLYGKYWGVDAVQPLGEAVTNASGQWTLTVGPLATGTYNITATVTAPGGYPITATLTNNGLVHIDMSPPKHPKVIHHPHRPKPPTSPPLPKSRTVRNNHRSRVTGR